MADYDSKAYDLRGLRKRLDAIEPKLGAALVRDAKKAGEPVRAAIKRNIPTISPLSGMNNKGRLGWGVGKNPGSRMAPNKTDINWSTKYNKFTATSSLVRVQVASAATALTDYAGRRSAGKTKSGKAMIIALNRKRRASRWAWPAAERALPATTRAVKDTIDAYIKRANKGF